MSAVFAIIFNFFLIYAGAKVGIDSQFQAIFLKVCVSIQIYFIIKINKTQKTFYRKKLQYEKAWYLN